MARVGRRGRGREASRARRQAASAAAGSRRPRAVSRVTASSWAAPWRGRHVEGMAAIRWGSGAGGARGRPATVAGRQQLGVPGPARHGTTRWRRPGARSHPAGPRAGPAGPGPAWTSCAARRQGPGPGHMSGDGAREASAVTPAAGRQAHEVGRGTTPALGSATGRPRRAGRIGGFRRARPRPRRLPGAVPARPPPAARRAPLDGLQRRLGRGRAGPSGVGRRGRNESVARTLAPSRGSAYSRRPALHVGAGESAWCCVRRPPRRGRRPGAGRRGGREGRRGVSTGRAARAGRRAAA